MRALLQIWRLSWRDQPWLGLLTLALLLPAVVLAVLSHLQAPEHGPSSALAWTMALGACWISQVANGTALRRLAVPESRLLPDLRWKLGLAFGLQLAGWIGGLVLPLIGHGLATMALALGVASLVAVSGVGVGSRHPMSVLLWLTGLLYGLWPHPPFSTGPDAPRAWWWLTPLLLVTSVALLAWIGLRLERIAREPEVPGSPMRHVQSTEWGLPGRLQAALRRWREVDASITDSGIQRAVRRYRRQPSPRRRQALVSRLLLPQSHGPALILSLASAAAGGWLVRHFMSPNPTTALAVVLGSQLGSHPIRQLGLRLRQMQPHLVDLYLAAAPEHIADYQRMIFNALRPAIICGAGSSLLFWLAARPEGWQLLPSVVLASLAGAISQLGLELLGPTRAAAGRLLGLLIYLPWYLAISILFWIAAHIGLGTANLTAVVVLGSYSLGAWQGIEAHYSHLRPDFSGAIE